jgi:hypothetical protein
MPLAHHRGRLAAAASLALAAGAAGLACSPSPAFPTPAQPLVGEVLFERELTMGTAPVDIRTIQATFHVDAGTVPVGTKLVVRILDGIVKELTVTGDVWSVDGQPAAVQVLSDAPTFARPIQLTIGSFAGRSGQVDVLHADEGAAAWTQVGQASQTPPPSLSMFTAELTEPHLWTFLMPPAPKAVAPFGLYRLAQLTCSGHDLTSTTMETLDIGVGRYAWTHGPAGDACSPVERGQIVFQLDMGFASFAPDSDYFHPNTFNIHLLDNDTFELQGTFDRPLECPANIPTSLAFVRAVEPVDAGAPPEASDGGCASDGGGSGDAQGG